MIDVDFKEKDKLSDTNFYLEK